MITITKCLEYNVVLMPLRRENQSIISRKYVSVTWTLIYLKLWEKWIQSM